MEKISEQNVRVGAGVIIIRDGKTLLAKRKSRHAPGYWGSCGGHVEPGETPAQAAVREAKEELGIDVGNLRFITCLDEQWKNGKQYIGIIFLADITGGEPRSMEPDKVEGVGWFNLDALPEPLFPPVKVALQAIQAGKSYCEYKE